MTSGLVTCELMSKHLFSLYKCTNIW